MKKVIVVLLLVLATVSMALMALAGCHRAGKGSQQGAGTVRVEFAQCKSDESDWRMANTNSMRNAFSVPGYQLTLADSNNDAARQIADVQGFIDQEYDYIVIAAVNMDGWDTVLKNAQRAGIPVILVDRTINADPGLYTCWIGSDFYGEGVKATEWMAKRFGGNTYCQCRQPSGAAWRQRPDRAQPGPYKRRWQEQKLDPSRAADGRMEHGRRQAGYGLMDPAVWQKDQLRLCGE